MIRKHKIWMSFGLSAVFLYSCACNNKTRTSGNEEEKTISDSGLLLRAEKIESDPELCKVSWKNVSDESFSVTLPAWVLEGSDEPVPYEPFEALADFGFDSSFYGAVDLEAERLMLPYEGYPPAEYADLGFRAEDVMGVPIDDRVSPTVRGTTVTLGPGTEINVVYELGWLLGRVREEAAGKTSITFNYRKASGSRGNDDWRGRYVESNALVY